MSTIPNITDSGGKTPPRGLKKPRIPDHEVLRCIGRGSYGEVWLARAVTGSMRAVKVVQREDFESDRTFEREFEGILKFEPISRNHPGLVDILHVGRHESEVFYYYVMELGDDRERGQRISPVDYEPRTLSTDRNAKVRFNVDDTVNVGIALAGGLQHLHERGLAHRDIKPSNIIFVDGVPKLADIGLVAEAGQRTYVGTEGFVPPEGPGSPSADIYSLGMVLYELSTGKDRLKFPELPDDAGLPNADRKRWRMLNALICKACDPSVNRRFPTARHLIDALRRVRQGKYNRPILPRATGFFTASCVLGFTLAWARTGGLPWPPGMEGKNLVDPSWERKMEETKNEVVVVPVGRAKLRLETVPPGATILMGDGSTDKIQIGFTPLKRDDLPTGRQNFLIKHEGFQNQSFSLELSEGENPPQLFTLKHLPPESGREWKNSLGMALAWKSTKHESGPIGHAEYQQLTSYDPDDVVGGKALVQEPEAKVFCERLLEADVAAGFLDKNLFMYVPRMMKSADLTQPEIGVGQLPPPSAFTCSLVRRQFGDLRIESDPPGAMISFDGKPVGKTPKLLTDLPAGEIKFKLTLQGYNDLEVADAKVIAKNKATVKRSLTRAQFKNSLGMVFNVVEGTTALFSVWETRVKDFNHYLRSTKMQTFEPNIRFEGFSEDHPVDVTRTDAMAFCQWLTLRERAEGTLSAELEYRLPTDEEWSQAADLHERKLPDPASRNQVHKNFYVWGVGDTAWPPPRDKHLLPGNFSDASRMGVDTSASSDRIVGLAQDSRYPDGKPYMDGYAYTAPVGKFAPNRFQLYDMCGNIAEWVSNNYGGKDKKYREHGVVRGGDWNTNLKGELNASSRNAIPVDFKPDGLYGFRCVVATVPKARVIEEDAPEAADVAAEEVP